VDVNCVDSVFVVPVVVILVDIIGKKI